MAGERELDIIIYGATGYTGRLVAEYLLSEYGNSGEKLKWAMAGRNVEKLAEIRDLIGASQETPLIEADSNDPASLDAMTAQTKVVLTTVGPYQLYGNQLVASCVKNGTGYVDLCGEPGWMRQQIDAHDAEARKTGAHITFSCGFDSIPFDLGVLMLQKECIKRFGSPAPRVRGRVRGMKGKFSGGTAASLKATMAAAAQDPALVAVLRSPFGLTPGFEGPEQPRGDKPEFEADLNSWAAPFVMAPINTKNVHRTNALLDHLYGTDFVYDEMFLTGAGEQGEQVANYVAANPGIGSADDPKPGEGPTKEERDTGFYDVIFLGEYPDGRSASLSVKGRYDPGYGSTSRMITESAVALLSTDKRGGVWTPGALFEDAIVERLQDNAEIRFTVEN